MNWKERNDKVERNTHKYLVVVVVVLVEKNDYDDDVDEWFIYNTIMMYSSIYCSFHVPIILF